MGPSVYSYKQRRGGGKGSPADNAPLSSVEPVEPMDGSDVFDDSGGGGGDSGGEGMDAAKIVDTPARAEKQGSRLSQITVDRPIFTLSVAADLLGLHPRTLRIYEEKKLVVPARTEGNRRRYSQNDIQRFGFIRRLTQGGVNLEGVRIILDMAAELTQLGGDPEAIIERNLQTQDER